MKIENFDYFSRINFDKKPGTAKPEDLDINLKVSTQYKASGPKELITSKFACTPGCPKGTFHSFCC